MSNELAIPENIDREAILRYLRLDPSKVDTQALLLICGKYGLDPLLKHIVLIDQRPYVTRDGYLHIAHVSGQFDGLEVLDEGESDVEWWAKVSCHRKDMTHPFTYRGRYPKSGSNKKFGPEMAVKTAESMAMRRAFDVTGIGAADERWDDHMDEPRDEAPCSLCGEMVPGARSDVEAMRQHRVEVHGWVRTPDGKVAPPQDPSGETPSPVSPDALPPTPPPSTDEVDGAAGADTQHSTAASAPAASISEPDVARLRLRLNTIPDQHRGVAAGVITATWGSLELVPHTEMREVEKLLADAEKAAAKAAKSADGMAARAAGHANQESAA